MDDTVLILLAAYKGGAYIRPMVDSILRQEYTNWRLILSDDGEDTAPILQEYADAYPDKITHYRSGLRFGSAQKHFMHLLRTFYREAPYIMFCDQDDVWRTDKIGKTLELMKATETEPSVPVLVHTDLNVVDGDLKPIAPSFLAYSSLDGNRLKLHQLLVQNVVTGCTVMINRALAALADRDVPEGGMLMHDAWLALLAAACGKCAFLPLATIDYRQHGSNTVGAKNSRSLGYMVQKARSGIRKPMENNAMQAGALLGCYGDVLSQEQKQLLSQYSSIFEVSKLHRIRRYYQYGLWKNGLHRKIAQLIWG